MSSHIEYSYLVLRLLVAPQEEQSTVNPDQGSGMHTDSRNASSMLLCGRIRLVIPYGLSEWKGHWTGTMQLAVDILMKCFSWTNILRNGHSKDGCVASGADAERHHRFVLSLLMVVVLLPSDGCFPAPSLERPRCCPRHSTLLDPTFVGCSYHSSSYSYCSRPTHCCDCDERIPYLLLLLLLRRLGGGSYSNPVPLVVGEG
jgi:hypothetical protein